MFQPPSDDLDADRGFSGKEQLTEPSSQDMAWQAEVVKRCLAGDERAFEFIVNHYGSLLLRTAYLLVRDEEAAKDIVQDVFLLAWKNLPQLREPAYLRTWLLKITVNQSTTLKRQWARRATLLREQLTHNAADLASEKATAQQGGVEDHLDLERAIAALPANQRTVLVLFYYHRMTMPEIASLLGIAENTLRKRLQAALEKTRRALQSDLMLEHSAALTPDGLPTRANIHRGGAR